MIPRNLVPKQYYDNAFIAGGYAACPALAHDMDVWVFFDTGSYPGNLNDARAEMLAHLQAVGFCVQEEEGGSIQDYQGVSINILKVAVVEGFNIPIHLMVCDAPVGIVLKNFDISTHQVALTPHGVVLGDNWTPTTQDPYIIPGMENEHTAGRLEKICNRYERRVNAEAA